MESTRRLSLTLLLVAPIISARRLSSEDLGLVGVSSWGDLSVPEGGDWGDGTTEPGGTLDPEVYDEGAYTEVESWLRRKRALDTPGDDLETAEQVLFRPTFRYKHLVKAREQQHRLREELRRQYSQNSRISGPSSPAVAALPGSTSSAQRKFYSAYPSQNSLVATPSSLAVAALPPSTVSVQNKYYNTYTGQNSPVAAPSSPAVASLSPSTPSSQNKYYNTYAQHSVYNSQLPTAQRVYPAQISNYHQSYQPSSQYAKPIVFPQNNQGFRPQRSPYAYLYNSRLN